MSCSSLSDVAGEDATFSLLEHKDVHAHHQVGQLEEDAGG